MMWSDDMSGSLGVNGVGERGGGLPSRTREFRLLGEQANAPRPANAAQDGWLWEDNYAAPHETSRESYGSNPWQLTPQFALFSEVDGWLPADDVPYEEKVGPVARIMGALRKLFLPGVLLLMGVGLVVAIATPAFARDARRATQSAGGLSGYWETRSSQSAAGAAEAQAEVVPVVEAKSDNAAPVAQLAKSDVPYDVVGEPSLSVSQIERVLTDYGSPAKGKGQAMYDLGVRYGIDPAYALAFFVHESGCGTKGVARFTNSLGNIRWTEGFANYSGYRKYATWEEGMEDWYKLITKLYIGAWNLRTVDKIIPVYAPWGDNNNPPAYIRSVKNMVDSWRGK